MDDRGWLSEQNREDSFLDETTDGSETGSQLTSTDAGPSRAAELSE